MQAPLLDLTDTVDYKGRDHGRCVGDVVCKHPLVTNEKCQHCGKVSECLLYLHIKREICHEKKIPTHLPDFDRCATQVGDAWQRATFATLGVRDHPAVTALQ